VERHATAAGLRADPARGEGEDEREDDRTGAERETGISGMKKKGEKEKEEIDGRRSSGARGER